MNIASIFDLKDDFTVSIQGEVRRPGGFKFVDVLTLKDIIYKQGDYRCCLSATYRDSPGY